MTQNNSNFDFGFGTEEFSKGGSLVTPYAQFLNSSSNVWGIAITEPNADFTSFSPDGNWIPREHEFGSETVKLWYTTQPRFLVLNKSPLYMYDVKGQKTLLFDNNLRQTDISNYKIFSYIVVWFLDRDNKFLGDAPLRLKLSGRIGKELNDVITPSVYKAVQIYKQLSGNNIGKDGIEIFKSHLVVELLLARETVSSNITGQSSNGIVIKKTTDYTTENFRNYIIRHGQEQSDRIKEYIEISQDWITISTPSGKLEADIPTETHNSSNDFLGVNEDNFSSPLSLDENDQEESRETAEVILATYSTFGWTESGLNKYLLQQYRVDMSTLASLKASQLAQIYDNLQIEAIRDMFVKSTQEQTEIPF